MRAKGSKQKGPAHPAVIANLRYWRAGDIHARWESSEHEGSLPSFHSLSLDVPDRCQTIRVFRVWFAIIALLVSAAAGLAIYPKEDVYVAGSPHFSTAELALEEHWIKGAAPILAANFDEVSIVNLNKDVEDSFVFDIALSEIYQITTDYSEPPMDLRNLRLDGQIEPFVFERSEIFCNTPGQKYCELVLAWDDKSTGAFTAVRLTDDLYGIVADNVLAELGVKP
jgi:hypothetical protein